MSPNACPLAPCWSRLLPPVSVEGHDRICVMHAQDAPRPRHSHETPGGLASRPCRTPAGRFWQGDLCFGRAGRFRCEHAKLGWFRTNKSTPVQVCSQGHDSTAGLLGSMSFSAIHPSWLHTFESGSHDKKRQLISSLVSGMGLRGNLVMRLSQRSRPHPDAVPRRHTQT